MDASNEMRQQPSPSPNLYTPMSSGHDYATLNEAAALSSYNHYDKIEA
jgi:hypothetical protein